MQTFYHGTPYENMLNIMENGIDPGPDGLVYMCEKPEDCAKFLYIRGIRNIAVFKIKIPKKLENNVEETFDHSYDFFKCRAFGYFGHIDNNMIEPCMQYKI